jgi:hypothetical protein
MADEHRDAPSRYRIVTNGHTWRVQTRVIGNWWVRIGPYRAMSHENATALLHRCQEDEAASRGPWQPCREATSEYPPRPNPPPPPPPMDEDDPGREIHEGGGWSRD